MGKCLSKQGRSKGDATDKAPYLPSSRDKDNEDGRREAGPGDRSAKVAEVAPQTRLVNTPDTLQTQEAPELPPKSYVSSDVPPALPEKKRDSRIPSALDVIPTVETELQHPPSLPAKGTAAKNTNDDEEKVPSLPQKTVTLLKKEAPLLNTETVKEELNESLVGRLEETVVPSKTKETTSCTVVSSSDMVITSKHSTSEIVRQTDIKVEMTGDRAQPRPCPADAFHSSSTEGATHSATAHQIISENTRVVKSTKISRDGKPVESVIKEENFYSQESKNVIKPPFSTTAPEKATMLSVKDILNQQPVEPVEVAPKARREKSPSTQGAEPMALLDTLKYLKSPPKVTPVNGEQSLDKNNIDEVPVITAETTSKKWNGISSLPMPNGDDISCKTPVTTKVVIKSEVNETKSEGKLSNKIEGKPESKPITVEEDIDYRVSDDDTQEMDDHTIMRNLKANIKAVLYDFSSYNDEIKKYHDFTTNTKSKLFHAIDRWFINSESERPRVMVIASSVGMGKTCIATEVCRKYQTTLAGWHYFSYNSPNIDHNSLPSVIISLAYQFCDAFPNYITLLPRVEKLQELLTRADVHELYNALVYTPLSSQLLDHDISEHMLIVIDALDECNLEDRELLLQVIRNVNEKCPEWLYMLATTRNENQILADLEGVYTVEIKRTNENMSDIKRYLREPLGRFMDRISLDGGLNQLVKKTESLFLCGYVLKKRLEQFPDSKKIALREVDHLFQNGLSANCHELFNSFREALSRILVKSDVYANILSTIVASREPLHTDFLVYLVGSEGVPEVRGALNILTPVLISQEDRLSFCSKWIAEWLLDEKESAECAVTAAVGHEQLASLCISWLADILGENQRDHKVSDPLKTYALKHAVYHLLDVQKQQENVAKVLCSLLYIQEKLNLPGVSVTHILDDYHHKHTQTYRGAVRLVSLKDSMKKSPKMYEQIMCLKKFLLEKKYHILQCPEFVLHVAANYAQVERIQSNARVELEGKPWLEDATAVPETHCLIRNLHGSIRAGDVSADGKVFAAVSKDEEYKVLLHIIDTINGEPRVPPIDIKSLNDRVGLQVKFMPDGNNIFVGSLTTLISKQGQKVQSGLDVQGIDLKEKFSIECCDASPRHFVIGMTTFPWGGRSLHLAVFDIRTKKCLKTFEVLRFRFGGNAQFGIRAVAVARDASLMCACVKQSTKAQLRVIVWNISKFLVINSIDVNNDHITKCLFVGDHTLILGSSIRSTSGGKSNNAIMPIVSETWHFKEVTNKVSHVWDDNEVYSLVSGYGDNTVACRWYSTNNTAVIELWTSPKSFKKPSMKYKIRGLTDVVEMVCGDNFIGFLSHDEISLYNVEDLETVVVSKGSAVIPSINDVTVDSVAFLHRSETVVLTVKENDAYTVYLCDLSQEAMTLTVTPFKEIKLAPCKTIVPDGQFMTFQGAGTSSELCFPSHDGNFLVFNGGDHLRIWDRVKDKVTDIPAFGDLNEDVSDIKEFTAIKGFASTKDSILAVLYGQLPHRIYLYDVKTCARINIIERQDGSPKKSLVTDLAFLPSNGFIMTYHRYLDNSISGWNARSGEPLGATTSVHISYAKVSPASDRLVISARKAKREGQLILRNSDNKFVKILCIGNEQTWIPSTKHSSVEFAADGTVVVGVCVQSSVCRVWNAGNGEVLQDLAFAFTCDTDIVGMVTNTHILFHDDRLVALDIASGEAVAILPLDNQIERIFKRGGLKISPKYSVLAGTTTAGHACVFVCHNFATVRRKTTLQRLKSISKHS